MDGPPLRDLVPIERVWARLEQVERRLYEVSTSDNPFVTEIAQHLLGAGKRYRPMLAQVAAEIGGADGSDPVEAGVAVELIHLGSLYHDDVIDEAGSRRGQTSVNTNWSNTIAILAGDFLLARASEVAAPLGTEAVALLARTYANLCEGQVLELQLGNDLDHGPEDYYRVIENKTASLIRTSARLGAMAGGADRPQIEAATRWGHEVGLVFQLTDDVLDLLATEDFLGKPAGSDIHEGTFTLPVIYALRGENGHRARKLLQGGKPYPDEAVEEVIDLVRSGGHLDRVLDETMAHIAAAEEAIAELPDSEVTKVLRTLGEYLVERVDAARQG
ncbi:MAG: polyprenyl synthetase family protein [Acidimicrobiia bacterium]